LEVDGSSRTTKGHGCGPKRRPPHERRSSRLPQVAANITGRSKEKDANARFKEVGEAYEVLRVPRNAAESDQLGKGARRAEDFRQPRMGRFW